ncbi:MAG: ABC transporter ATP-binding protein [Planctomycetota bacterium]
MDSPEQNIIECDQVTVRFGTQTVLNKLTLDVKRGERLVILGGSGAGKSTLLNLLAGVTRSTSGHVRVDGQDICGMTERELDVYRKTIGVLFQSGALFQSMTLGENVALPLREHTDLDEDTIDTIVKMKLELVGLREHAHKLPGQISGGMKKRAGLARALSMDPKILFYDEPSAGLDPVSVTEVDQLMIGLNETLGVTTVVITHEMTSAFRVAHRLVLLDQGQFVADGTPAEMKNSDDPLVYQFVNGRVDGPLADRRDSAAYTADLLGEEHAV